MSYWNSKLWHHCRRLADELNDQVCASHIEASLPCMAENISVIFVQDLCFKTIALKISAIVALHIGA